MFSLSRTPAIRTTISGFMLKTRVILPTGPRFSALKNRIELAQKRTQRPMRRQSFLLTEKKLIPHTVPHMKIAPEKRIVLNARTSKPLR